jgi:hypothetical protein
MANYFPNYRSFAGCAGFDCVGQAIGGAGKFVTDSVLGEANHVQQQFHDHIVAPQVAVNNQVHDAIFGESHNIQVQGGQAINSTKDAANSTWKFFTDPIAQLGPYLPYIAVGGGLILLIILLKK